jgi:hypothetical protein
MKHIVALLLIWVCVGCSTPVAVKPKFPDAPAVLMEDCPPLKTIDKPKVVLSELMTKVTENYTEHYKCVAKIEAWQTWYIKQKEIYDQVK